MDWTVLVVLFILYIGWHAWEDRVLSPLLSRGKPDSEDVLYGGDE